MFSGTALVRMLRLKWYVRYVQVFSATIKLRHNRTAGKIKVADLADFTRSSNRFAVNAHPEKCGIEIITEDRK